MEGPYDLSPSIRLEVLQHKMINHQPCPPFPAHSKYGPDYSIFPFGGESHQLITQLAARGVFLVHAQVINQYRAPKSEGIHKYCKNYQFVIIYVSLPPLRRRLRLRAILIRFSPWRMSRLSEKELGLIMIGEGIWLGLGSCLLRSKCWASSYFLVVREASSFLRGAREDWREASWLESSPLMIYTLSLNESSYFFSSESPDFMKRPAATMTLIASQTLLLMFLLSLDQLEKLSISTLLIQEYLSLRLRSKRRASLPEMNLRPFTSSASSRSSSRPPLARPLSSPITVARSPTSGGKCHSSSPFIYQFIRLAPLMQNFTDLSPHLDGSSLCLASTPTLLATIGSDDILFQFNSMTKQQSSSSLSNPNREEVTVFAVHPTHPNSFAIGTKAGVIKNLRPVHQMHLQRAEVLYKGDKPINHISFSHDGKLIGIGNDEEQAYVYSIKEKRLFTLSQPHEGGTSRVSFAGRSFVYSVGMEGNLILYSYTHSSNRNDESQSDDLFSTPSCNFETSLLDKYRFCSDSLMRKHPFCRPAYAEFSGQSLQKLILCPGQTFLQVITLAASSSSYRFDKAIKQLEEILIIEVVGTGLNHTLKTIATSTLRTISIWNYKTKEKMHSFETKAFGDGNITSLVRISTVDGPTFAFVLNQHSSSGKIHYFHNLQALNRVEEQMVIEGEQEEEAKQPIVRRDQFDIEKLLPNYTHFPLEKYYEEYQNAQFLYYNNIGCVIQRIQGENSFLELEIHDRSRTKRMHLQAKNRPFSMFSLKQQIFIYASSNQLVFQAEPYLKVGIEGWEFRAENIQGISIGGNWIGVCCQNDIRILDFGGSELHSVCFDRRMVAIEAFEDILVIVYNSAPPMWGCRILKAKIYKVNMEGVKMEKDVLVPLSPNSLLKWFGFSQEGMLICQDTMERVSCFRWDSEEWQLVYSLEKTTEKFYIQHVSGCDLYGFKLDQPAGQKNQPKVLPRSLPRRFPMEPPFMGPSFLTKEESSQLSKLLMKNMQIEHEEFRYRRWFKYKYSRNKDHPFFLQSRSILSAEEIKTIKSQFDLQIVDLLKKYVGRSEGEMSTGAEERALMSIISRQAHFEQTKQAARKILGMGGVRNKLQSEYQIVYVRKSPPSKTKLNQISILEKISLMMSG